MKHRPLGVTFMSPISGADWGGVEKWMLAVAKHLRRRGHRVSVCGRPGSRWLETGLAAGFDGRALPFVSDLHLIDRSTLEDFFVRHAVDVCVVKTLRCVRMAWAARLPGLRRPSIVCRLGDARIKPSFRARLTYRHLVDAYVTPSRAVRDEVVATGYVPANRIAVVPNGVRVPAPDPGARDRVRRELGLGEGPVLIVTSRLHESKGHVHLLAALERLRADGGAVPRLLVAGDGRRRAELEREARRRGLGEEVRFLGFREDVTDLLRAADLFVLPSLLEGLPNTALEAMAGGLPVVATTVDGVGEAVVDGVTGTLVPPGDPASLAAAIRELLSDPARRRTFGAAGLARVRREFTLERTLTESEAWCLGRRTRHGWQPQTGDANHIPTFKATCRTGDRNRLRGG